MEIPIWLKIGLAVLLVLVGVDVWSRVSAGSSDAPPRAVATETAEVAERAARGSERDAPPARRRAVADRQRGPATGGSPLWTTPPVYPNPEDVPQPPPLTPEVQALIDQAAAAARPPQTDIRAQIELYEKAEGLVENRVQRERIKVQRMRLHLRDGNLREARRLAEELGARPVLGESREWASRVLATIERKERGEAP